MKNFYKLCLLKKMKLSKLYSCRYLTAFQTSAFAYFVMESKNKMR